MIKTASASVFYRSLEAAIRDGGTQALSDLAECAASERDLLIKAPCVAALACWGDAGFQKIIANVVHNRTSKDTGAALKTLALIAANKPISSASAFFHDDQLLRQINESIIQQDLSSVARRRLSELVMMLPVDDLLIPLGNTFTHIGISDDDIAGEIVGALSSKWLGFGPYVLVLFASRIDQKPHDEPGLHAYLERFPQMLDPMAV